jgi:Zn-finger nucleic acid-binding protein
MIIFIILKINYNKMMFTCEKPSECPVCYEALEDHKPLSCGHWVHKSCIIKSKKDNCPMCRAKVKLTRREREEMISLMTEEEPVLYQQPSEQEEELPYTIPSENTIVTLEIRRRFRVEED